MTSRASNKIGDLNGWWSRIFRATLTLLIVCIIPLNVWYVSIIYEIRINQKELQTQIKSFMGAGPRFTLSDAKAIHSELEDKIFDKADKKYAPIWKCDNNTLRIATIESHQTGHK